jgi:hypothetical protein
MTYVRHSRLFRLLVAFVVLVVSLLLQSLPLKAYTPSPNIHPIEGFADVTSAAPGQTVKFYVSLPKSSDGSQRTQYSVEYFRFGAGGSTQPVSMGGPQSKTNGINQQYTPTSYLDGVGWAESFQLTIPTNWPSGIYGAKLVDAAETGTELKDSWVTFMVKAAANAPKPIAFLAPTNTYQAYNFWPGESGNDDSGSFYANCSSQNARTKISFQRPNPAATPINLFASCGPDDPNVPYPRNNWRYFENVRTEPMAAGDVRLARWLERENYDYSVISDWDLDQDWADNQQLNLLDPATTPLLIIGTHSEYWSQNMYNTVQSYLDRGGNVMVLGGNTLYWRVTLARDPVTGNRTIEKGPLWSDADRQRLFGIGTYNPTIFSYCYSNLTQVSTAHWAYKTPNPVQTGVVMGDTGEMKTPANECIASGNHAKAVGWETDYAHARFARNWVKLAGVPSTSNTGEVFYFQRPSAGSVFVAGSITFGQSLIQDASETRVMTKFIKNVIAGMDARTFSDFSAADPNNVNSMGKPDLVVRRAGEDSLRIYRGNGQDGFTPGSGQVIDEGGWGQYNTLLPVGDFDSDGDADLLGRDLSGSIHFFKGNGAGGFESGDTIIRTGWGPSAYNALLAPGDWDGDGYPDVITRTAGGTVELHRGNGAGNLMPEPIVLRTGMNGLTLIAPGDFDYNVTASFLIKTPGQPDLLARLDSTGELRLYHGNGAAGFSGGYDVINQGWNGLKILGAGDFDGDSHPDLFACVSADNTMRVYHGTGGGTTLTSFFRDGRTAQGTGWACDGSVFAGVW